MIVASSHNTKRNAKPYQEPEAVQEIRWSKKIDAPRSDDEARLALIRARKQEANVAMANALQITMKYRGVVGGKRIALDDTCRRICKALNVRRGAVMSSTRQRDVVFARQAVMYWLMRKYNYSCSEVGRIMIRDHTSVISGVAAYVQKRELMGRKLSSVTQYKRMDDNERNWADFKAKYAKAKL